MKPGDKVDLAPVANDKWTVFTVQRDNLPEILTVNDALRGFAHRQIFPWHLNVIIRAKALGDGRLPTAEENAALNAVGEQIERALRDAKTEMEAPNVLTFAHSNWNGQRQLIFRVHDPEIADRALKSLMASKKQWERDWGFQIDGDDEWVRAASILSLYPLF